MAVLRQLDRQCPGCPRHVHLLGGRAAAAAVYPGALCRAVCLGVKKQMELDAADQCMLRVDGSIDNVELSDLWNEELAQGMHFWDDVSGNILDLALVREARAEEVREAERMGVWTKVPRSR